MARLEYSRTDVGVSAAQPAIQTKNRKWRLLTCAFVRQSWRLLTHATGRRAVQISEKFADRNATKKELDGACLSAHKSLGCFTSIDESDWTFETMDATGAHEAAAICANDRDLIIGAMVVARILSHTIFGVEKKPRPKILAALRGQANLVRDLFGNPFRPIKAKPAWFARKGVNLAKSIYEKRAFDRTPMLADALEQAGCNNADILDHCRKPAEHVRGCWVVDLLLGKE
jgi:hypothetical protein